jgi:hypothetical protein
VKFWLGKEIEVVGRSWSAVNSISLSVKVGLDMDPEIFEFDIH